MKSILRSLIFTLSALGATTAAHAGYEYDWTGGEAGYAGTIILDSSANASGSAADILSGTITTPEGTYAFDPTQLYVTGQFDWNSSQITDMYFDWTSPAPYTGFGENVYGAGLNFVGSAADDVSFIDTSGSWVAAGSASSAPDLASSLTLLTLGLGALGAGRRRLSRNGR